MNKFLSVAKLSDIHEGAPNCINISGKSIAVYKVDSEYYVTDNQCTHTGGPLCQGSLKGKEITCPWHKSKFDVTTGAVISGPAIKPVTVYKTRINGDVLEAALT